MSRTYMKDPTAILDYAVDWVADGYLSATTPPRTITAAIWDVYPVETGGVTIESADFTPAIAAVVLSGGVIGHIYRITNRITMNTGATDERSFVVRIENT